MNLSKKNLVSVVLIIMLPIVAFAQTVTQINAYRWINTDNVSVYSDYNLVNRKTTISKGTQVYVSNKYTFSNGRQVAQIQQGYVDANNLGTAAPTPTYSTQTEQTLSQPQWIQKLPSNVTANQDYTISWAAVANAQKYRVYFTQGGKTVGWDYLPTGTSQTVKIPNVSGTVYIGLIAMPSDYNKYNQSELDMSFTVSAPRLTTVNISSLSPQYTVGQPVYFGATVTPGTDFMWYNVYIKNSNNSQVYAKEKQTSNNFSDTWNSTNYPAGTYTVWIVPYKKDYTEDNGKTSKNITLIAQSKPTSVKLNSPSSQYTVGQSINISATITPGTDFMWYNVYIKNSNNSQVYAKEKQTSNNFSDTWNSTNYPLGTYTAWIVPYKKDYTEDNGKTSNTFTLIAAPTPNDVGGRGTVSVPTSLIPNVGAILKSTSGTINSIYIPVSTLKSIIPMISGKVIDLNWPTDGVPWQEVQQAAAVTALAVGTVSPPLALGIVMVVEGAYLSDQIISGVVSGINLAITGYNSTFAKKIIEYASKNSSGFVVISMAGVVSYTADTKVESIGMAYFIPLNQVNDADAKTVNNVLSRYNLTPTNVIQGSIKTQSNTSTTQTSQTFTTSNYTKIGKATLLNYGGKNYIGDINATSGFQFTVSSTTAKTANLSFVYRTDPNRSGKLIVNGSTQIIMFDRTGWSSWGTKTVQVSLKQGTNTILFYGGYPTNNDYAPDIAEITVK